MSAGRRPGLSFHARLVALLVAAALLPMAGFGVILLATGLVDAEAGWRVLLLGLMVTLALAVVAGHVAALDVTRPLRALAAAAARVGAGERAQPVDVPGDDLLARLAERQNRLGADTERRNRQLAEVLAAVATVTPGDGAHRLIKQAASDARSAFGLIDTEIVLVDPASVAPEERIPGESLPILAEIRAGADRLGILRGHLPATSTWQPADQALLDLFAREVGVALRNAELFARVEVQNAQLRELAEAKDDFLRGVSHNLQTPLTSIRLYAAQVTNETQDHRTEIIVEQADRLSRMVRQLLTVSRLESGTIRPRAEVLSLAPRVRRAWEALGIRSTELRLRDDAQGWLAIGDADQLDQVLWALLDNAVKHGKGPVEAEVGVTSAASRIWLRILDHGPGIAPEDRDRLFQRFARGTTGISSDGSGLGLYVARELIRNMGGDLILEPAPAPGEAEAEAEAEGKPAEPEASPASATPSTTRRPTGATFRLTLPAEAGMET